MKNAFSIAAKHSGKGVGMENKSLTIADTPSLHTSRTEHRFQAAGSVGSRRSHGAGADRLRLQAGDAPIPRQPMGPTAKRL